MSAIETLTAPQPSAEKLPEALFNFRYRGVSNLRMRIMYSYREITDFLSVKTNIVNLAGVRMDAEGVIHLPKKYETDFEALMKALKPGEKGAEPGCLRLLCIEPVSYSHRSLVANYPLDKAPVTFRLDLSRKDFRTFTYTKLAVTPVLEEQPDKARQSGKKAGQAVRGALSVLFRAGSNAIGAGANAGRGFFEGVGSGKPKKEVETKPKPVQPRAKVTPIELVAGADKTKKAVAPLELISEEPAVASQAGAEVEEALEEDVEQESDREPLFQRGSGVR